MDGDKLTGYRLKLPNGSFAFLAYENKDEDRNGFVKDVLEEWGEYCRDNWLSKESITMFSPGDKVKWLLNGCANFLLMNNHDRGILSKYKENVIKEREFSVEHFEALDTIYDGELPPVKTKRPHRGMLLSDNPVAVCRVDTEGIFRIGRTFYKLSDNVTEYLPDIIKSEPIYKMDTVYVEALADSSIFYNMNFERIPDGYINEI